MQLTRISFDGCQASKPGGLILGQLVPTTQALKREPAEMIEINNNLTQTKNNNNETYKK